jgi:hypothetical protein
VRAEELPRRLLAGWDFNGSTPLEASQGQGQLVLLGGVVATNFLGAVDDPGRPNGALSLRSFPVQSRLPREAGIELRCAAGHWRELVLEFQIRASGTASRRIQCLVASGDGALVEAGTYSIRQDGVFETVELTLPEIRDLGASDELRIRLVSDFDDGGVYSGVKPKTDGSNSYSAAGTWRLDLVRLTGIQGEVPADPLRVSIRGDAGAARLEWTGAVGGGVTLWEAATVDGPWVPVSEGRDASGYSVSPTGGVRYYRITSP